MASSLSSLKSSIAGVSRSELLSKSPTGLLNFVLFSPPTLFFPQIIASPILTDKPLSLLKMDLTFRSLELIDFSFTELNPFKISLRGLFWNLLTRWPEGFIRPCSRDTTRWIWRSICSVRVWYSISRIFAFCSFWIYAYSFW